MSRIKLRSVSDVCADCGATDASWASVNRGLLLCDECCSVHRSLGRHISQVKSLKKGAWNPTQLAMVHTLYSSGANSIWEHTLLDPCHAKSGRRKPNAKDPLHPIKADFIRAKHQNLAFVYRPGRDEGPLLESDLSKQLHSSVRTANLETSLRLLSLGADPNYLHPDKENTPLHMAAKSGQISQVELLCVYGADPAAYDRNGKTPIDYAREAGHHDLADRLVECQYELTDRLAYYLCGRKPDHQCGQHFIIPEMSDSLDLSELAKAAKRELQALPNQLFEELAKDVYDEVDRRENDAVWLSTQNHSALVTDRQIVPFLPVNPEYSPPRNQGRQKLARFNAREFATLIIDILNETKRRQLGSSSILSNVSNSQRGMEQTISSSPLENATIEENISDDEPLYDSVASDDEATGGQENVQERKQNEKLGSGKESASSSNGSPSQMPTSADKVPAISVSDAPVTLDEYLGLKRQLALSENRIQQLLRNNRDMKQEISMLQSMVQTLIGENCNLRSICHHRGGALPSISSHGQNGYEPPVGYSHPASGSQHSVGSSEPSTLLSRSPKMLRGSQRPQSMYEPRERQQQHSQEPYPWTPNSSMIPPFGRPLPRDDSGLGHTHSSHSLRNSGDYDNTSASDRESIYRHSQDSSISPSSEASVTGVTGFNVPGLLPSGLTRENLPTQEEVVRKTEKITKKIQELLISAQEGKHDSFIPCSEKIYQAVSEMASIFPQTPPNDSIGQALKQLTSSALRLRSECKNLLGDPRHAADYRFVTQQVIQCAYDIAKGAKQVVTIFQ